MTSLNQAQLKRLSDFLDQFDCSSVESSDECYLTFMYEAGSNEGCYMTLGEYWYRCNAGDEAAYTKAVQFYLSLLQEA